VAAGKQPRFRAERGNVAAQPDTSETGAGASGSVTAHYRPEASAPAANAVSEADRNALERYREVLLEGQQRLRDCSDYTATFYKREKVDGELRDPEELELKVRHEPFSIFLKWPSRRQAVYIEGENDNRLVVQEGGLLGKLGALKLEPSSRMAMKESRYPVTELGLLNLTELLLQYRERDLTLDSGVTCRVSEEEFEGRPCLRFEVEYASPAIDPVYRHSVALIDLERSVPLSVVNHGWPEGSEVSDDESTLLEHYAYRDLELEPGLEDADFVVASSR